MARSKEMFCETRTVTIDGKEMDLIRFNGDTSYKIHNWDKPAVRDYSSGKVKKQYFLYGIEYTKDEFQELVSDRSGLPWFKNPSMQLNARY